MIGVASADVNVTRFQAAVRPRETQAEELLPDIRSVCELDNDTVPARAIEILPVGREFTAICQRKDAALSICEGAFASRGEDRVTVQVSNSGPDIASEYPCSAEILQDLRAHRHERTPFTKA